MSDPALGLARLAAELGRDLQRASRRAGGPAALWALAPSALGAALALDAEGARRAAALRRRFRAAGERDLLARTGIGFVARGAAGYPPLLDGIYDPPFGLFTRPVDPADAIAPAAGRPVVAIVGARRALPAARLFARGLAGDLARAGAVIVSGLAHGVDAAAHEGALEAGGTTVAVLGCGPDVAYPRRNRALLERVAATGAICSEYWPGTRPAPWRFPARNRIVAGLAHATVVVEAGARSGALITADFALEHGRGVLAVPGAPWSAGSEGCNELLRHGAALCTRAEDVVDELPGLEWAEIAPARPEIPEGDAAVIHAALGGGPRTPDELAELLGMAPARVIAAVGALEVLGAVVVAEGRVLAA